MCEERQMLLPHIRRAGDADAARPVCIVYWMCGYCDGVHGARACAIVGFAMLHADVVWPLCRDQREAREDVCATDAPICTEFCGAYVCALPTMYGRP
mmetsp:Transcript_45143/g.119174  ORF Transcript_45143/g.119174 Transcript_45143/m.119174 type:complete len:97 (-) Transcript_45143:85-375(-)|eukprot:6086404-Prymnesium_polylepis.1